MNHPIRPATGRPLNRRHFILTTGSALVLPWFLPESTLAARGPTERRILPMGPASKYVPRVRAAFVRRQGDYGMLWPGAVFDGEKARRDYTAQIKQAEKDLGVQIDLRPEPIYSAAEADAWLAEAKAAKPDGLLLMVWDRQAHAWPTAVKAADTGLPLVIFSPLGTAFTINTAPLAERTGVCLCSTNDFKQARAGLKMIRTAAKLREMRYLVLQGGERRDTEVAFFGTKLRYLPAKVFLEEYRATPDSEEIQSLAAPNTSSTPNGSSMPPSRTCSTASRASSSPAACWNGSKPTASPWTAWALWAKPRSAFPASLGPRCSTKASRPPARPTSTPPSPTPWSNSSSNAPGSNRTPCPRLPATASSAPIAPAPPACTVPTNLRSPTTSPTTTACATPCRAPNGRSENA